MFRHYGEHPGPLTLCQLGCDQTNEKAGKPGGPLACTQRPRGLVRGAAGVGSMGVSF